MNFAPADRLQNVQEYYFSQKLREIENMNKAGKAVINLGIGNPDLPPHASVIEALEAAANQPANHGYQSYKGSLILRTAITDFYKKWYGVTIDSAEEVLPLLGSKEGIMHICMAYLQPGDAVLVPDPGYPTYAAAAKLAGATVLNYALKSDNDYEIDYEQIRNTIVENKNPHVKAIFANYPQMPTGKIATKKIFQDLVSFCQQENLLLIHDNPYSFILNENPQSIFSIPEAKEYAIELNSLSKSHNMAGWRVGMMIADKEKIDTVMRFRSNMDSGMFLPVQLAAAQALSLGKDWFSSLNENYITRREKMKELMELLHCEINVDQAGMFLWGKTPAGKDGFTLCDEILYGANVFITPGGIFGSEGNNFIRLSLCSNIGMIEAAIDRIKRWIDEGNV